MRFECGLSAVWVRFECGSGWKGAVALGGGIGDAAVAPRADGVRRPTSEDVSEHVSSILFISVHICSYKSSNWICFFLYAKKILKVFIELQKFLHFFSRGFSPPIRIGDHVMK